MASVQRPIISPAFGARMPAPITRFAGDDKLHQAGGVTLGDGAVVVRERPAQNGDLWPAARASASVMPTCASSGLV